MTTPTIRRRQTDADRQINRLRNCMPERFNTYVKMHLSFLLDLDGAKLEEIIAEPQTEAPAPTKRKGSTPFSKKKSKDFIRLLQTQNFFPRENFHVYSTWYRPLA